MADTTKYLDYAGVQTLVTQIKAEDTKVKNLIGSLEKGETKYESMRTYVDLLETYSGTATKDVGGISKNTDLTNKTLKEILELMLSPYVATSGIGVTAKNASGGNVTTSGLEKGNGFTIEKAYISWTAGSTQVKRVRVYKGAFTSEPTDKESSEYYLGGATLTSGTNTTIDITDVSVATGSNTAVTLTAFVFDKDETQVYYKQQSFGSWYVPYFYGKVDKDPSTLTNDEIIALTAANGNGKGKISFGDTAIGQYVVLCIQGTISSAKDPSGFENFANFTKKDVTLSRNNWSNEAFHMYYTEPGLQTGWFYTFS